MTFLLDTSVIVDIIRNKPLAIQFLTDHQKDTIITSTICEAEVSEGIYREKTEKFPLRQKQKAEIFKAFSEVISFDSVQADITGQIRAFLAIRGEQIGDLDILIAAAAISTNAMLVTQNPKHFSRIENLQITSL